MQDAPEVEERYITATNTSNLKISQDRPGAADVLIAAGWSASRLGAALMRLHSEFDGAARASSETDARLMAGKLKSLPTVVDQLMIQAVKWGINPAQVLPSVCWWLDKNCRMCEGRKFERLPEAPVLSAKQCTSCRGTGQIYLPGGDDARRITHYMDDCVNRARDSIKKRLRHD